MEIVQREPCVFSHTGEKGIVRTGCVPGREWIPQDDMKFCPFCSRPIKVIRIAREMPTDPAPVAA